MGAPGEFPVLQQRFLTFSMHFPPIFHPFSMGYDQLRTPMPWKENKKRMENPWKVHRDIQGERLQLTGTSVDE